MSTLSGVSHSRLLSAAGHARRSLSTAPGGRTTVEALLSEMERLGHAEEARILRERVSSAAVETFLNGAQLRLPQDLRD